MDSADLRRRIAASRQGEKNRAEESTARHARRRARMDAERKRADDVAAMVKDHFIRTADASDGALRFVDSGGGRTAPNEYQSNEFRLDWVDVGPRRSLVIRVFPDACHAQRRWEADTKWAMQQAEMALEDVTAEALDTLIGVLVDHRAWDVDRPPMDPLSDPATE